MIQPLIWAMILIAAWLSGCLVNLLADQLPLEQGSLQNPICLSCGKTKSKISFLTMAPCADCSSRPSIRIWIVQVTFPLIFAGLYLFQRPSLPPALAMLLIAYMGLVVIIDIEHHLVLGPVSLAGFIIGGAAGIFMHGWQATLLGAMAGFGLMYAIYWLGRGFSAWMSKRNHGLDSSRIEPEAMGFGDVYIATISGFILGWPGITAGLVLGILLGGGFSAIFLLITMLLRRYKLFTAVAYAPFLVTATLGLIFWPK